MKNVDIHFGRHLLDRIPSLCEKWGHRSAIIADQAVKDRLKGEIFSIIPEKTREAKERLEDQLLESGFGRDSVLVAVGGGTTTDLVGFLASTYMRGVPLILVPSTLLGMVDAAIGGKTAIDTPFGKNLIGTFYMPKAIVIDLELLKTLPEKEMVNGRSEILKMALIHDPSILELDEEAQIMRAIQAKIAIVEQDPMERGLRRILNFGHTIGHAIELSAGYTIAHGEAVALGCVAESFLSMRLGFLAEKEFEKIVQLFPKFKWTFDMKGMLHDKKRSKGKIRFVLIDKIGSAMPFDGAYCSEVPEKQLNETIHWMEKNYL